MRSDGCLARKPPDIQFGAIGSELPKFQRYCVEMQLSEENTQFFTFFSGLKNLELIALEGLAASFRQHYNAPLWVMDQHKPIQKMIEDGERIYNSASSFFENVTPDLDIPRLETFFSDNSDFIHRIEVSRQYTHGEFINEALNVYRTLPFAVVLDSDVWIKNSRFLTDLNNLVRDYPDDEVIVAGFLIQEIPFNLPSEYQLSSRKNLPHKLGDWLIRRFGFRLRRGKLPGMEQNFFWINGEMFTKLNMSFQNLRLNILDTTTYNNSIYKLLGDNFPSILYQAAWHGKTIVNIDVRKYRDHIRAQATSMDSRIGERSIDWFMTQDTEWPPKYEASLVQNQKASIRIRIKRRALSRLSRLLRST